jgi:hypothetical protein
MRLVERHLQRATDAITISVDDGFQEFLVMVFKQKKPNPDYDKPESRGYNFKDKETALQFADAEVENAKLDGYVEWHSASQGSRS